MLYLGIDLGTTFSLAAYVNDQGLPTLFPDFHDANEFRTPSVVHIGEDGCLVGSALEELLEDEPDCSHARFFKLQMGNQQSFYEDHLGRQWWPQSLSALVLKKILRDIETFAHEEIGGALISVPSNFNDAQRRATKEAATLAGLARVKLIEEPVAAATFYGYSDKTGEQTLFVYDLGGGTFDATVLQVSSEGLYALATEGSNRHGGKHVDELIMAYIREEFQRQHGFAFDDAASQLQLRQFAQSAKIALAKPGKTRISKTLVLAGRTLDFVLTKELFNQLLDQFVDETLAVCQRCLDAAGMDWSFIDSLLLTGGSSLLPLVADKLARISAKPKDQLQCKQPHQAVAYGAALLAEQEFGMSAQQTLQSICSYDLGIRVLGKDGKPAVKVLVKHNTPVPTAQTTTFYTNRDDQTRLIIEAVQRRNTGAETEESSLGYFAFSITNPRKNYPVEIQLAYDLEGIVTVSASDPATGQAIEQVMDADIEALDRDLLTQQALLSDLIPNQ